MVNELGQLHSLYQKYTVWYFDNYQYPTQGESFEILRGRGILKTKFVKGKHELKLKLVLPEVMEGFKAKKPSL